MLPSRYFAFAIVCVFAIASLWAATMLAPAWWLAFAGFAALVLVGLRDLTQSRQAIRRNYPLLSHFRFFFERIRPEIRQYLLEDDTEELPFSRVQRSIVYQRAKNEVDKRPFGTQLDVYAAQYEWINHSIAPTDPPTHDLPALLLGSGAGQPTYHHAFSVARMS